jgi:hypothetical protein
MSASTNPDQGEDNEEEGSGYGIASDNHQDSTSSTRLETVEKIEKVIQALMDVKWTLPIFLKALVQQHDQNGNDIIVNKHKWRTPYQRRKIVSSAISQLELSELNHNGLRVSVLQKEFQMLRKQQYFGLFDTTTNIETLNFDDTNTVIKATAPLWHELATELLQPVQAKQPSYKKFKDKAESRVNYQPTAISHQLLMITSMICMSQSKQKSNFLSCMLDMYLIGSGVKRRVVETLSGLGICHSYHAANRLRQKIASSAKVCIQDNLLT